MSDNEAPATFKRGTTRNMKDFGDGVRSPSESENVIEPSVMVMKLSDDFKNSKLVGIVDKFAVTNSIQFFGVCTEKQNYGDSKDIVLRKGCSSASRVSYDEALSELKGDSFSIAIACRKGKKFVNDPMPNQDNIAVTKHLESGYMMVVVSDGHGPFGHLVSFRITQSVPWFIANHPKFKGNLSPDIMEAVVSDACSKVDEDLKTWAKENNVDVHYSGATLSIGIVDRRNIFVAWLGDSKTAIGCYNRKNSEHLKNTQDHCPQNEIERQRVEKAGCDVIEFGENNLRLCVPGTDVPGLSMTRCFGDLILKDYGLIPKPEFIHFPVEVNAEIYLCVASDGLWEFLTEQDICNYASKKLRLKGVEEASRVLLTQASKRWEYVEDNYCDDISFVIVQFNGGKK